MISKRSSVAAKYTEARATTQPPVSRTSQTLLPKPWTPKSYITNPINPTAEKLSHAREPLSIRKRIPKWSDFRTTSQCPSETAMRNGGLPWNREVLDKSQTPEKATSASCLASPVYSFFSAFLQEGLNGFDTTCCFYELLTGFCGLLTGSFTWGFGFMLVDLDSSREGIRNVAVNQRTCSKDIPHLQKDSTAASTDRHAEERCLPDLES